jgi:hypothetical protein
LGDLARDPERPLSPQIILTDETRVLPVRGIVCKCLFGANNIEDAIDYNIITM